MLQIQGVGQYNTIHGRGLDKGDVVKCDQGVGMAPSFDTLLP